MRCLTGRLNIAILRFAGRAGRRAFQFGVVPLWEKEDMPLVLAVLIIVVTTFRHEGSHALATLIEGVELIEVRLFPGYREDVGFFFGYVIRGDGGSWFIDAAPFLVAAAWLGIAFMLLRRYKLSGLTRLIALAVGIISPLVDLVYNYQGGLWRDNTDAADLFAVLPNVAVHLYFVSAISLCILGLRHLNQNHAGDA